jgi:transcriptional regulator GlxA family with amidase domain
MSVLNESAHERPAVIDGSYQVRDGLQLILRQLLEPDCALKMRQRYFEIKSEEFFITAMDIMHREPRGRKAFELTDVLREKAEAIEALLHERLDHPWSLNELRKKVTSNTQTIQEAFKARYGQTIIDYQLQLRLDYAARLLLDTNSDLDTIAIQSGFYDKSSLSNAFRKKFKCAPGAYRRGR